MLGRIVRCLPVHYAVFKASNTYKITVRDFTKDEISVSNK